jgi:hypothetical protein
LVNRIGLLRNRTLEKTLPCLLRVPRAPLLSAKRTDIEVRRRAAHQQSYRLPLYGDFSANGADGVPTRRVGTKEACPFGQPLVESVRPIPLFTGRGFWPKSHQKASDSF